MSEAQPGSSPPAATPDATELANVEPVPGEGPILPGLPGHDPNDPSPEELHEIEREAAWLIRNWYRYPPLDKEARHRGVSLLEALEYHFVSELIQAVIKTRYPDWTPKQRRASPGESSAPETGLSDA